MQGLINLQASFFMNEIIIINPRFLYIEKMYQRRGRVFLLHYTKKDAQPSLIPSTGEQEIVLDAFFTAWDLY